MPFFFDMWSFYLLIPAMLLALWAQARVSTNLSRFSQVPTQKGMSGKDVAAAILYENGIRDVAIERLDANSGDHYDPSHKVIRLSAHVHDSSSVTAVAVAAHEAGHAIQHSESYSPLVVRGAVFPIVRFASGAAVPLIFIGFILGVGGGFADILIDVGIIFFAVTVAFHLITLPVEFNASRRAAEVLEVGRYLNDDEMRGTRKVLNAAALTYVAAATMAVMQLLRFLLIRGSRN
ncbi:MAG: zinc metallopeptidase [Defluviitaleaceae bacterium]|nr:zinc metallopeptidase [Defluviitaleaceae bacterium]